MIPHVTDPAVAGMVLAGICDVLGKAESDHWVEDPSSDADLVHFGFWIATVRGCGLDESVLLRRGAEAAVDFRAWLQDPTHERPAFWQTLESSATEAVATIKSHWIGDDRARLALCKAFARLMTYDGGMNANKRALLDVVLGGLEITPQMWATVALNPDA